MDTRRLLLAIVVAFGVYLAYMYAYRWIAPAPPLPPASTLPEALREPATENGLPAPTSGPSTQAVGEYAFSAGVSDETTTIGGGEGDSLRVELTPRGAAVSRIWITQKKDGRYVHRVGPRSEEPYELVLPAPGAKRDHYSFSTHQIWIEERDRQSWTLDDLVWERAAEAASQPAGGRSFAFVTTLAEKTGGGGLLRLTKTYTLLPGPLLMQVELAIENVSGQPLHVVVAQDGPTGIRRESVQYEMRRLLGVSRKDGELALEHQQRPAIKKAQDAGEPKRISSPDAAAAFVWTGLVNKFFGVFTRPLPGPEGANLVQSVNAYVDDVHNDSQSGDLRARIFTPKLAVPAGGAARLALEVYAGPRDPDVLKLSNPEFVDKGKLGYVLASSADSSCCVCTFEPLPTWMSGLLRGIYFFVRNYGVAIIIVVLIIRTLLHPLSVFQQKSMYRMQEAMGRIQPKMAAIKERHANDKMKMNQEMMKLWSEENVNPAASLVSFVPLFLQMPILVALWTAMNSEIQLRNAPFDGWWIVDLSAPDALISFGEPGLTIPILGWIPWIGPMMFSNIPSFNLLPILMGVSMWLQQKYMPKPHMQARREAARQQSDGGTSFQDQMRQQQMMANMMSVMFPLMFYYMPAGLNLYWMATNIVGIAESLIIRKQLERDKERRAKLGPPPAKKPGAVARIFKWMAEQGEQLQNKADNVTEKDKQRHTQRERDSRKKR